MQASCLFIGKTGWNPTLQNEDDIIKKAYDENWILITNDKDFGEQVYRNRRLHKGVILLRLKDESASSKIFVLSQLLQNYPKQLADTFIIATEKQVRFTRP